MIAHEELQAIARYDLRAAEVQRQRVVAQLTTIGKVVVALAGLVWALQVLGGKR